MTDQKETAGGASHTPAVNDRPNRTIIVGNLGRQGNGGFDRRALPDPVSYFEAEGLQLTGRGKWRTTSCAFHGGRATMRVNTESGAFACMACCGTRGGDVLAYHMAQHGLGFVDAAKALGCWVDDGRPPPQHKPSPLTPRVALEVLNTEANLVAIAAGNLAHGVELLRSDFERLKVAANRIGRIAEVFA